jgi:hypothetical protein
MTENNMDKSPSNSNPLEPRMDSMLTEFFRNEIPAGLGKGQLNWSGVDSQSTRAPQPPTVVSASATPGFVSTHRGSHKRIVLAMSIATIAACIMLVLQPRDSQPDVVVPIADGTTAAPVVNNAEELMLVSPNGDQPAGDGVVGDHGLTIGETDSIGLSPRKP